MRKTWTQHLAWCLLAKFVGFGQKFGIFLLRSNFQGLEFFFFKHVSCKTKKGWVVCSSSNINRRCCAFEIHFRVLFWGGVPKRHTQESLEISTLWWSYISEWWGFGDHSCELWTCNDGWRGWKWDSSGVWEKPLKARGLRNHLQTFKTVLWGHLWVTWITSSRTGCYHFLKKMALPSLGFDVFYSSGFQTASSPLLILIQWKSTSVILFVGQFRTWMIHPANFIAVVCWDHGSASPQNAEGNIQVEL